MYDFLSNLLSDHKGDVIFKVFGLWHILMMFIIFIGIFINLKMLKNKSKELRRKVIVKVINIVFIIYMLDFFLMPLAYGEIDIEKLPFHICTVTCVLAFLSRHNKFFYRYRLHFAVLGLISNLIYLIYPAGVGWYQIAPFTYRVIQTLLFHGLMTLYGVLTLFYDEIDIRWKEIKTSFGIILLITIWALLGNLVYNTPSRIYNWFFVVQDPFLMLPKDVARIIMPFIMVLIMFTLNILVYVIYFNVKKVYLSKLIK